MPTPQALVEKMLDLAKITPERHPLRSRLRRRPHRDRRRQARRARPSASNTIRTWSSCRAPAAEKEKVSDRATFIEGDIFKTDFSKANVITLYLLTSLNAKLRPIILEMQPGTRVASNSFDMGDWRPDTTVNGFDGCQYCTAHYWIVPARVAGTWKLPNGELRLQQRYQVVNGTAVIGGKEVPITDGKLTGAEISFTAGGTKYTGKVDGNSMEGTAGGAAFKATRG